VGRCGGGVAVVPATTAAGVKRQAQPLPGI
jgi:hypothetical protein